MANIGDLFTKYNCTNCQEEITGIRVHCAECENFDLCLECFSTGAEIGPHQNNHDYQFMDTGTSILSVFPGKGAWTAKEEIWLLDAMEQYGFGNWEDVSKHIETKSAEDAKEEYIKRFVTGTIGRHTWGPAQAQRPSLVDHTSEDTGPLGAAAIQRLPPLDITSEEAAQLGYMPNRDSFEREYDPTAEQLICTMALSADDTEADYLLKLAHVDMYTRRLRERARRKRIVRDYQLVANFFRNRNYAQHPGMTREQKEFRDRFRVFAQFYTSNEYERLLSSLEREKELRIRLAELCRYRYNGLTKIDECRHFEQHAAMALNRSTGPYGLGKTDNMHHSNGGRRQLGSSVHSPQPSSRKIELANENEANLSSIASRSMPLTVDQTSSGASLHNKNYLDSCRESSVHTTISGVAMTVGVTPMMTTLKLSNNNQPISSVSQNMNQQPSLTMKNQAPQLQLNDVAVSEKQQLQVQLQQGSNTMDQSGLNIKGQTYPSTPMSSILRAQLEEVWHLQQPLGTELLTTNEQQVCKNFNLPPTTYLSLKTLMLSGAPVSNNPSPIENLLRKYFIKVGWLSH